MKQPSEASEQVTGQVHDRSSFAHFDIDDSGLNTPDDDITRSLMPGQSSAICLSNHLLGEETVGPFDVPFAALDHPFSTNRNGILTPSPNDFQTHDQTSALDCSPAFAGVGTNWDYAINRDDTLLSSPRDVSDSFSPSSHTRNGFSASFMTPSRKESLDERCILAATQIINALESCIARPHQLDVVLRTVRKAGVGLNGLIDLQKNIERKNRCVILFTMILYQNLDLLETVVDSLGLINMNSALLKNNMPSPSSRTDMAEGQLEHLDAINCHIASLIYSVGNKEDTHLRSTWARKVSDELSFGLETIARIATWTQASGSTNSQNLSEDTRNGGYIEPLKIRFEQLRLLTQRQI